MTKEELEELIAAIAPVVRGHIDQRIAAVPAGKDGVPGPQGPAGEQGSPGEPGIAGKDGAPGPEGIAGAPGANGADGAPGKDGVDGRDGVDGKDGRDGADGKSVTVEEVLPVLEAAAAKWMLEFERRAADQVARAIEAIPVPRDGVDGLGIEDLEAEDDGEGNVTLRFSRGEVSREFKFRIPCFRDRGVYSEEVKDYLRGDGVSSGGSLWIAQKDAPESRPGTPGVDGQWRLAVKKGRDGKDGKVVGPPTPPPVVRV